MFRWHYNISGQQSGPLIRDCELQGASTIAGGAALTYGATTNGSALIVAANTGTDFVGVLAEDTAVTVSTTAVTTGTYVFGKTILHDGSVYEVEWDPAEANDVDVVSSTSTATTVAAGDDDMEGGWIYINSGTGEGQLGFIGAASTTVYTLNTLAAWTTTPDSTSDVMLIRRKWRHPNDTGVNTNAAATLLESAVAATGRYLILENYLETAKLAKRPLHARGDHMRQGIHNSYFKFSSDILPVDSVIGSDTMA